MLWRLYKARSCQRAEDIDIEPDSTRTRFFQPEPDPNPNPYSSASLSRFKPEIIIISLNFKEISIKKKMSFVRPQSHQLRTVIFIQDVLIVVFHQLRKLYHLLKISILLRRPAGLKPDNFSKSKADPGPNSVRTRHEKPQHD